MSMPTDRVTTIGQSRVQHGKASHRVYLMHLEPSETADLLPKLDQLAQRNRYGKIFAKAPVTALPAFVQARYREEARVPKFFQGKTACVFLAKYLDPERRKGAREAQRRKALDAALARAAESRPPVKRKLPQTCTWALAEPDDANELAALYREVFETYPFPIHDPDFIRESMDDQTVYGCVRHRGGIIAVASAEKDRAESSVEMTDFAIRPDWRGRGLAPWMLARLETAMAEDGIQTAFTIARGVSIPMNKTFAGAGYRFGGTLINNTQICGRLESMNVWYKALRACHA